MFALAFYAVFMLIIGKYMRDYHPRTLLFVGGYLAFLAGFYPRLSAIFMY